MRQIAVEFSRIDRIRKGKPIIVCGDGKAIHQFLHVDDAAKGFTGVLGKQHCIGQSYNLVNRDYYTWQDYHRIAMKLLGKEVELVGVPLNDLVAVDAKRFDICEHIFAHNCYYSADKIFRDIPEFQPGISLQKGMEHVIQSMMDERRIPETSADSWEDRLINAQLKVREISVL